jgi:hypothetical protein
MRRHQRPDPQQLLITPARRARAMPGGPFGFLAEALAAAARQGLLLTVLMWCGVACFRGERHLADAERPADGARPCDLSVAGAGVGCRLSRSSGRCVPAASASAAARVSTVQAGFPGRARRQRHPGRPATSRAVTGAHRADHDRGGHPRHPLAGRCGRGGARPRSAGSSAGECRKVGHGRGPGHGPRRRFAPGGQVQVVQPDFVEGSGWEASDDPDTAPHGRCLQRPPLE